jgi:antirestriction protein ArdC
MVGKQIEGLPEVYYAKAAPIPDPLARIDHAEKFFAALGATIRHGGNGAFYSIAADVIQMPLFESFKMRIVTMQALLMNVLTGRAARPGASSRATIPHRFSLTKTAVVRPATVAEPALELKLFCRVNGSFELRCTGCRRKCKPVKLPSVNVTC